MGGHPTNVGIGSRSAGHVDTSYRQNGRIGGGVQDCRTRRADQLYGVSQDPIPDPFVEWVKTPSLTPQFDRTLPHHTTTHSNVTQNVASSLPFKYRTTLQGLVSSDHLNHWSLTSTLIHVAAWYLMRRHAITWANVDRDVWSLMASLCLDELKCRVPVNHLYSKRTSQGFGVMLASSLVDSKVYGANMGPTWDRQDPGGPHVVGPMNLAIWGPLQFFVTDISSLFHPCSSITSFSPFSRASFWIFLVGGCFRILVEYSYSQLMIQRYSTVKTPREATLWVVILLLLSHGSVKRHIIVYDACALLCVPTI